MLFIYSDTCSRGQILCDNGDGVAETCCNDPSCDLDRIKSLPWDQSLGVTPGCYKQCSENKCNNTGMNRNIYSSYIFISYNFNVASNNKVFSYLR